MRGKLNNIWTKIGGIYNCVIFLCGTLLVWLSGGLISYWALAGDAVITTKELFTIIGCGILGTAATATFPLIPSKLYITVNESIVKSDTTEQAKEEE